MKRIYQTFEKPMLISFIGSLILFSCGGDDGDSDPRNEVEVITTLNITFTALTGGTGTEIVSFRDLDGVGGNPPQVDDILLENGALYTMKLELLNESEDPPVDITLEVRKEDDEHQFFFTGSVIDNGSLEVEYNDRDGNGNPLGLANAITTQSATLGTFIVTLKHQPDGSKVADPVDITVCDIDIEVTFDVAIQ
ncbi:MAG: type 1 periplasmic binding fold superfamily protein [Bacteroidetes bacterium]|nr:type 1 periplasmic binding fold superfamily protein [Bacteroidota bacterium]